MPQQQKWRIIEIFVGQVDYGIGAGLIACFAAWLIAFVGWLTNLQFEVKDFSQWTKAQLIEHLLSNVLIAHNLTCILIMDTIWDRLFWPDTINSENCSTEFPFFFCLPLRDLDHFVCNTPPNAHHHNNSNDYDDHQHHCYHHCCWFGIMSTNIYLQ